MLPSMEIFLKKLHESNPKAAILSIYPGYLEGFNCKTSHEPLPQAMSVFYNQSLQCLPFTGIIAESNRVFSSIEVTTEEVQCLEKLTQKQSLSNLWYNYRAGRITASKFKQAAHSDPFNPSFSLITSICYPEKSHFQTDATR